nr:MAG TPA: hypothetical protein [Caudoviricetes sp.]
MKCLSVRVGHVETFMREAVDPHGSYDVLWADDRFMRMSPVNLWQMTALVRTSPFSLVMCWTVRRSWTSALFANALVGHVP